MMVPVSNMHDLKMAVLQLTPSMKQRRSKITFELESTPNSAFKPGIEWYELWQNDGNKVKIICSPKDSAEPIRMEYTEE